MKLKEGLCILHENITEKDYKIRKVSVFNMILSFKHRETIN